MEATQNTVFQNNLYTVMLLLMHTWKKPAQDIVTTWGEKHQLKRSDLQGGITLSWNPEGSR